MSALADRFPAYCKMAQGFARAKTQNATVTAAIDAALPPIRTLALLCLPRSHSSPGS